MDTGTRLMLKGMIRGLAESGSFCNQQTHKTRTEVRSGWRGTKAKIGDMARYVLLVMALLRDVPYRVLESKTRHPVKADRLVRMIGMLGTWQDQHQWTAKAIQGWLEIPETESHAVARRAAEEEGRRRYHARGAASLARRRTAPVAGFESIAAE